MLTVSILCINLSCYFIIIIHTEFLFVIATDFLSNRCQSSTVDRTKLFISQIHCPYDTYVSRVHEIILEYIVLGIYIKN